MKELMEVDLLGSHGSSIKSIISVSLKRKDLSKQYDDGGIIDHYEIKLEFHNGKKETLKFVHGYGGLIKPWIREERYAND